MSSNGFIIEKIRIRSFDREKDRARIEELERKCEKGPKNGCLLLFTDTMGDPLCRIRNSPLFMMLVAELGDELVGIICGSIKLVSIGTRSKDYVNMGYILGLRVSPLYRRRGIGSCLVRKMEEWFINNFADYVYMATERDNDASIQLFTSKLGFLKFRSPTILVNPVAQHSVCVSASIEIKKLEVLQAEHLYRKFVSSAEFFPQDIDQVLMNKLSLGTWIAYPRGESWDGSVGDRPTLSSWAMLSVWNCGEVFKIRVGRAPWACILLATTSRMIDRIFPVLRFPVIPDVFSPFGFYFMYGMHAEGPEGKPLMRSLCDYVHNMAMKCKDCKVIVTEVGGCDTLRPYIPHWKLLSCSEDIWCIKALKKDKEALFEWIRASQPAKLFVDPREV